MMMQRSLTRSVSSLQIGLDLVIAYSEGEVFEAQELDIDVDEYRANVEAAASGAFNLAVNAGIINETTIEAIVGQAAKKARNLSISEGIPTDETIEEILAHAASNAKGLDSQIDLEPVEESESEEETEDEDTEDSQEE